MLEDEIDIESEGLNCICGNICVVADPIEEENEHVHHRDIAKLKKECQEIFKCEQGEIHVTKFDKALVTSDGSTSFCLICSGCKSAFRLITTQNFAFICRCNQKVESSSKMQTTINSNRNLQLFFPLALRPFIVPPRQVQNSPVLGPHVSSFIPTSTFRIEPNIDDDDDADFEMMFSNKNDCIVGSFTHQWIYNI